MVFLGWVFAANAAETLSGQALVTELRKGAYVLYIRHASTDFSKNDANMASFEDCANQRPLTEAGRAEARAIAGHIKRLGIPIGRVLTSPFCRTVETAMLAFGKAEASSFARGGPVEPGDAARYAELKRLMSLPVEPGGNRVISGHANPFRALTGLVYLAEGEIAVLRPGGPRGFETVARIRVPDWEVLSP